MKQNSVCKNNLIEINNQQHNLAVCGFLFSCDIRYAWISNCSTPERRESGNMQINDGVDPNAWWRSNEKYANSHRPFKTTSMHLLTNATRKQQHSLRVYGVATGRAMRVLVKHKICGGAESYVKIKALVDWRRESAT